jgi:hypothetical protein
MWWIAEAGKLHGKALLVGNVLWHLKGLNKKWTVALSNIEAEQWGITRQSKRRALAALSDAGLIAIENFRSRSPKITLIDTKTATEA